MKFQIPQCVLLSLRSQSDFQSRCYSPGLRIDPRRNSADGRPRPGTGDVGSARHRTDPRLHHYRGVAAGYCNADHWATPVYRQTGESIPQKSIAVLPFENLSEAKANAYFADGIQAENLTKLAGIGDLKVISRSSTAKYKSKPEDLKTAARELGVGTVLEGRVKGLEAESG